jgi:hypothetical protein
MGNFVDGHGVVMAFIRKRFAGSILLATVAACTCGYALAADGVLQCKDSSGKLTYTNVPCEGQVTKPESLENANYSTPYGEWLGQVQFKETVSGQSSGTAHAVAALTIKIDAGGKITGASSETGCHALGIALPGPVRTVLSIDVTLTSCQEADLNQRYTGTFALYSQQKYAAVQLMSTPSMFAKKIAVYGITGTLRR